MLICCLFGSSFIRSASKHPKYWRGNMEKHMISCWSKQRMPSHAGHGKAAKGHLRGSPLAWATKTYSAMCQGKSYPRTSKKDVNQWNIQKSPNNIWCLENTQTTTAKSHSSFSGTEKTMSFLGSAPFLGHEMPRGYFCGHFWSCVKPEGNCQQHQRIQERNLTSISWDIMGGFHPLGPRKLWNIFFDYKLSPDNFEV